MHQKPELLVGHISIDWSDAMKERFPLVTNAQSVRVRTLVSLGKRSFRQRKDLMRVEGPQATGELLLFFPNSIVDIYIAESLTERYYDFIQAVSDMERNVYLLSDQLVKEIASESQGILVTAKQSVILKAQPSLSELVDDTDRRGPLVLLPQTQDPGNAGTIIRNSDAFSATAIISCPGTVDLFSPKVIRASVGSVFHLPVIQGNNFFEVVEHIKTSGWLVLGTSGGLDSVDIFQVAKKLTSRHIWIFGNEANGLTDSELEVCDYLVRIPMTGLAESLNVSTASAICLLASQQSRVG